MSSKTKLIILAALVLVALAFLWGLWSSSSVFVPILASIGGIVVWLGLWIEKEADEELHLEHISNLVAEKAKSKRKAELGWWILMVGVGLEVVLGFGLAVKAEIDAQEALKNEPINQPVTDISAKAVVNIRGFSGEFWQKTEEVEVELTESRSPPSFHLGIFSVLTGETVRSYWSRFSAAPSRNYQGYVINLSPVRMFMSEDGSVNYGHAVSDNSLMTAGQFLSNIDTALIILKSFPKGAELVSGGVEVLINRTFRKRFRLIPNQSTEIRPSTRQADFNRVFLTATNAP